MAKARQRCLKGSMYLEYPEALTNSVRAGIKKLLGDFQLQLSGYKAGLASLLQSCKMPDITSNIKYFLEFTL